VFPSELPLELPDCARTVAKITKCSALVASRHPHPTIAQDALDGGADLFHRGIRLEEQSCAGLLDAQPAVSLIPTQGKNDHEHPREDLADLAPARILDAAVGTVALTIDGVIAVDEA